MSQVVSEPGIRRCNDTLHLLILIVQKNGRGVEKVLQIGVRNEWWISPYDFALSGLHVLQRDRMLPAAVDFKHLLPLRIIGFPFNFTKLLVISTFANKLDDYFFAGFVIDSFNFSFYVKVDASPNNIFALDLWF